MGVLCQLWSNQKEDLTSQRNPPTRNTFSKGNEINLKLSGGVLPIDFLRLSRSAVYKATLQMKGAKPRTTLVSTPGKESKPTLWQKLPLCKTGCVQTSQPVSLRLG